MKDALATGVGTADKPESLYSRRLLNQDLDAGYIRIEHPASNGASDEFDDNVRAPIDDLSDTSRTGGQPSRRRRLGWRKGNSDVSSAQGELCWHWGSAACAGSSLARDIVRCLMIVFNSAGAQCARDWARRALAPTPGASRSHAP